MAGLKVIPWVLSRSRTERLFKKPPRDPLYLVKEFQENSYIFHRILDQQSFVFLREFQTFDTFWRNLLEYIFINRKLSCKIVSIHSLTWYIYKLTSDELGKIFFPTTLKNFSWNLVRSRLKLFEGFIPLFYDPLKVQIKVEEYRKELYLNNAESSDIISFIECFQIFQFLNENHFFLCTQLPFEILKYIDQIQASDSLPEYLRDKNIIVFDNFSLRETEIFLFQELSRFLNITIYQTRLLPFWKNLTLEKERFVLDRYIFQSRRSPSSNKIKFSSDEYSTYELLRSSVSSFEFIELKDRESYAEFLRQSFNVSSVDKTLDTLDKNVGSTKRTFFFTIDEDAQKITELVLKFSFWSNNCDSNKKNARNIQREWFFSLLKFLKNPDEARIDHIFWEQSLVFEDISKSHLSSLQKKFWHFIIQPTHSERLLSSHEFLDILEEILHNFFSEDFKDYIISIIAPLDIDLRLTFQEWAKFWEDELSRSTTILHIDPSLELESKLLLSNYLVIPDFANIDELVIVGSSWDFACPPSSSSFERDNLQNYSEHQYIKQYQKKFYLYWCLQNFLLSRNFCLKVVQLSSSDLIGSLSLSIFELLKSMSAWNKSSSLENPRSHFPNKDNSNHNKLFIKAPSCFSIPSQTDLRFSSTELMDLAKCPVQFLKKRRCSIPVWSKEHFESSRMNEGSWVHKVFELLLIGKELDLSLLLPKYFSEDLQEVWSARSKTIIEKFLDFNDKYRAKYGSPVDTHLEKKASMFFYLPHQKYTDQEKIFFFLNKKNQIFYFDANYLNLSNTTDAQSQLKIICNFFEDSNNNWSQDFYPVEFRVTLDRLDIFTNAAHIIDYKRKFKKDYLFSNWENLRNFQFILYFLYTFLFVPKKEFRFFVYAYADNDFLLCHELNLEGEDSIHFTRHENSLGTLYSLDNDFMLRRLGINMNHILLLLNQFANGIYNFRTREDHEKDSTYCSYCGFFRICEASHLNNLNNLNNYST